MAQKEQRIDVGKAAEAEKLFKKANKEINPSLLDFRLKPDWEAAAPLFEKAALTFKQAGLMDRAIEAYERSATSQEKLGSQWHAAKHYETLAEFMKGNNQWDKMASYTKQAGEMYVACGKAVTAADAFTRGARGLEECAFDVAFRLYLDALELYEMEGKEVNGYDTYRACVDACIKNKRWEDAVEILMRFGAATDKTGARTSQCKCYLGAVVCHLARGAGEAAWHCFQDCLQIDAFVSSDEAFSADALFNAYRSGMEEAVQKVVKDRSAFKHLDNHVARTAVKLPLKGTIDRVKDELDRVMGRGERQEEDEAML